MMRRDDDEEEFGGGGDAAALTALLGDNDDFTNPSQVVTKTNVPKPPTQATSGDVTGTTTGTKGGASSASNGAGSGGGGAYAPSVFQGFQPRHAMEGFDFNREQNTGRSAKDAFAWLANQAPPPPTNDKQQLQAWFEQYIRPGMDALGHHVTSVNGDTFGFSNWQGDFTVDYGRGAGAEGGALAWQVDPGTAVMPDNPTWNGVNGGGAQQRQPTAPVNQFTDPLLIGQPNGNNHAMDEVMQEIEALMSGSPSAIDAQALQQLLAMRG